MAAIDKLMDARPDTSQGDQLDVLVARVCAWEEQHQAIHPPDAIEIAKRSNP